MIVYLYFKDKKNIENCEKFIRVKNHDFTTGHRHPPGSTPSFPRYYIFMRAERPILLRFF
jgi:hypothetical protein